LFALTFNTLFIAKKVVGIHLTLECFQPLIVSAIVRLLPIGKIKIRIISVMRFNTRIRKHALDLRKSANQVSAVAVIVPISLKLTQKRKVAMRIAGRLPQRFRTDPSTQHVDLENQSLAIGYLAK